MSSVLATAERSAEALSLTGRKWIFREADARQVTSLAQKYELPHLLANLLAARGVALEDAEQFLNPTLKASLPDPSHLLDMDAAAERVAGAVVSGERIAIFGDYDVDGATSSALLARYLRSLGADPVLYIPDRMKEGYGPNAAALIGLKVHDVTLVITVDCGTLAFEPLQAAHESGLDVIVIDHHAGEVQLPKAYAVVNPNRLDETSPHGQLAAVGVAFLLVVAVNRKLREVGYFSSPLEGEAGRGVKHGKAEQVAPLPNPPLKGEGIFEPDPMQWLDLVALGTICDVVPLTGVNRALVAQGLKIMALRGNCGLRTVLDLASVSEKPGVYHAGFVVGPRINAGGRVGKSDLGVRLLVTEDEAEALGLARELDQHNGERKAIEAAVLEEAMAQAETADAAAAFLMVSGNGWHPGVIGIVAGRLKERFHKPAAVIACSDGIGKASARSVHGMDIGAAVIAARQAGILSAGGGHAMAAGFTMAEKDIAALSEFFTARLRVPEGEINAGRRLFIDGAISVGGATAELAASLERLGPFGQGNPQVRLVIQNAVNLKPEWTSSGEHLKTLLIDRLSSARLSAIAFRAANTKLAEALLSTRGKEISVAGQLRLSEWNGKPQVSLMIEDVAI